MKNANNQNYFNWGLDKGFYGCQFDSCTSHFLYAFYLINRVLFAYNFLLIIDFRDDSIAPFKLHQKSLLT